MRVGLINTFDEQTDSAVAWQIEQVRTGNLDELWLASPHEDAYQIAIDLGLELHQVYDLYSQTYLAEQVDGEGLWFYDLPVPNQAQLVVNQDWSKSIVSSGRVLADVRWFANSNRLVQAVTWLTAAGQVDRKDIYQRNGRLFAKQYFHNGQLLQSDFYLDAKKILVQDFYFQGLRNLVIDQRGQQYPSAENYLKAVMMAKKNYQIQISRFGREFDLAIPGTTLVLPTGVLDEQQEIIPALKEVLLQKNHVITKVLVRPADYAILESAGLPLNKVDQLDE